VASAAEEVAVGVVARAEVTTSCIGSSRSTTVLELSPVATINSRKGGGVPKLPEGAETAASTRGIAPVVELTWEGMAKLLAVTEDGLVLVVVVVAVRTRVRLRRMR
jgi:hypothetical protein